MLKDTIISAFNYDGTLLKWLKKVEDALQNASASEFRVNKKGNATISFSIVFANGDTLESGDIILQQGESVTGATIRQGHLILTLTNGDELDAGDVGAVTGFSINTNQHLIVTYQNGTTQDLGAIFTGNVNINGNFTANSIIENMNGYAFGAVNTEKWTPVYASVCKNGNKLSFVVFGTYTYTTGDSEIQMAYFRVPEEVGEKLIPYTRGVITNMLSQDNVGLYVDDVYNEAPKNILIELAKNSNASLVINMRRIVHAQLENGKTYLFRYERTFLLGDNLA